MATTTQENVYQPPHSSEPLPLVIWIGIGWNIIVGLASLVIAVAIFQRDAFDVTETLGNTVQNFLGIVALIPTGVALYSSIQLPRKAPSGRYAFLGLHYVGMVLASFYLLHLWGVFVGFDSVAAALYENAIWLWGLIIGYGIFWIAGRFDETNLLRLYIERIAIFIAMGVLFILLIQSDAVGAGEHILNQYGRIETWVTTIVILIFGVLSYNILHLGNYFHESPDQRIAWQGWLMVSPNVIGFMLFFAGPLLFSLYLSFTEDKLGAVPKFVAFDNYRDLLSLEFKIQDEFERFPPIELGEGFTVLSTETIDDNSQRVVGQLEFLPVVITQEKAPIYAQDMLSGNYNVLDTLSIGDRTLVIGAKDTRFWVSMRNTIWYCLLLVPLSILPALGLALILNSKLPGVQFFRAIYFLPSVAAIVGTALIWRTALFSSDIGYINVVLTEIVQSINSVFGTEFADVKIGWLSDPSTKLFSVVIMGAWQIVGFNTVLFLAGLQGVPKALYEAASVDGAGRWGQFRNVTLPLIAPTTFFVTVTTIINGLQVFNEPFVLFPTEPPPAEASTAVLHLYRTGFTSDQFGFGYSSAVAWLLFALIFLITIIQFRVTRSQDYA